MNEPHDIIKTASLTEKSTLMGEKQKADVNAIAQKAFGGAGKDNDKIQFIAEGGKTAKLRWLSGKVPCSTYLTQVRLTPSGTECSALHATVHA